MDPFDEPDVPVSCSEVQPPRPSRFAEGTAFEGSAVTVPDPVDGDDALAPDAAPRP